MARCTAPRNGHRTASGRENCPACSRGYHTYGGYSSYSGPSHSQPHSLSRSGSGGASGSIRRIIPRWARLGSSVLYTEAEVNALTPVRENLEKQSIKPDLRDIFLCHAWNDRKDSAKELYDLLESLEVSVWFSEKDIPLGTSFLREIDKGLANSRVGIVLVTPAFLERIKSESIAEKELSALLFRDQLVPIVHKTTYEELRSISPLLGSRNGLSTYEDTMADIAAKLAELVTISR